MVYILDTRTSRDHHIMVLLRSLLGVAARFNFSFEAPHIPGVDNPVADALSRFNWQVFRLLGRLVTSSQEILHRLLLDN